MHLPHEILDEIFSYLPLDDNQDQRSLRDCSLVAKSWTSACRRRLFETVEIREKALLSWWYNILPTNHGLLRHVRSLSYITDGHPGYRVDLLRDYLPSFYQLQHLSLSCMHVSSRDVEIFSAFRHTLSRLSFAHSSVTVGALVTLINYFPSLNRLDLEHVSHKMHGEPVPAPSRPIIRELHISNPLPDSRGIFDQLAKLGFVFDKVVVDGCSWQRRLSIFSRITGTVGVNARHIGLHIFQPCAHIARARF